MILGLDTATEILHLALVDGQRAWTKRVMVGVGRSHSVSLLPALDELMQEAGASAADLHGVCCCAGPGGFTSIRIGVATAEGLALTGLPTWGFSSFLLRAQALKQAGTTGIFWVLLDGQRNEVFLQRWDETRPARDAQKAPLAALPGLIGQESWYAPSSLRPKLEAHLPPSIQLADEGGSMLAGLASLCRELPRTPPENPIHPFYLRETDAEVNFPEASAHLGEALRKGIAR
ncbi:MAG: tRNA (adenosine(37)-N6)-threonylcarbamoyltransferase complex dimerization subunit type 1 TsaB [Acidobacteriota bacterium]|nr:tRNA (adenosine(37)-N6)-threonylcarbamoyltransferase complex dimerization subunit type 1 TsaB [Acidobacteriota bacterium]